MTSCKKFISFLIVLIFDSSPELVVDVLDIVVGNQKTLAYTKIFYQFFSDILFIQKTYLFINLVKLLGWINNATKSKSIYQPNS